MSNESEIEDEFTLGGDDDEFSLGEENDFTLGDGDSSVESEASSESDTKSARKSNFNVDMFYDRLIKPFVEQNATNYLDFLNQSYIEAPVLYNTLGLKPFQEPTEEDKERIRDICNQWSDEGVTKYQRTDLAKSELITDCTGAIKALFTTGQEKPFREGRTALAWNEIDSLIDDKCDDGKVELSEMLDITKRGKKLGLSYDKETNAEFNKNVTDKIKAKNAEIETVEDCFYTQFQDLKETDPNIIIDTPENRLKLAKRYAGIKLFENQINGITSEFTLDAAEANLDTFLATNNIFLKTKEGLFEEEYFNDFKKQNKDKKTLSDDVYFQLKNKAVEKYGFTQEEWTSFEKKHKIKYENAKEQLQKERAEKEQNIKNAKRNGVLRNFGIVLGCIAAVVIAVVIFKIVRPVEYASVLDSITAFFNPSEEQKAEAQARKLAKQQAKEEARQLKLQQKQDELAKKRGHESVTFVVSKKEGSKYQTVQSAIDAAVDTDIVLIEPGIYTEAFTVSKNITITSGAENESLINSQYFSSDKVPVFVLKADESVVVAGDATVSGLVFTNASNLKFSDFKSFFDDKTYVTNRYSELYHRDGSLRNDIILNVSDSDFSSIIKASGNAKITNSVFTNINQYGVTVISDSPVIEKCFFQNISCAAVYTVGKAQASVNSSTVNGIMIYGLLAEDSSVMNVNNTEITQLADVKPVSVGSLASSDSKINFNSSKIYGVSYGASYYDNSTGTITNSTFTDDYYYGIESYGNSSVEVKNSNISSNSYGGVYAEGNSKTVISDSTFNANNTANLVARGSASITASGCSFDNTPTSVLVFETAALTLNDSTVQNYESGVSAMDNSNVTINGCMISTGTFGILAAGNTKVQIYKTTVSNNSQEGLIGSTESTIEAVIEDSVFTNNNDAGISIFNDSKITIKNSDCSNNYNYGIALNEYASGTITDCTFNNNSGTGIYIHNHGSGNVSGSSASGNKNGAFFEGSGTAKMSKCNFNKNTNGYVMIDNATSDLTECKINENTSEGLYMSDNTNGTFTKCTVKKNGENNFSLTTKNKPVFEKLKASVLEKLNMWLES